MLYRSLLNSKLAVASGLCLLLMLNLRIQAGPVQESSASTETQTLHVLVGKSLVVNLETRLTRVMVSSPNVISAVPTSPTQVVVSAKAVGASSLILWDETGRSRMLDVLVDLDVAALRDSIQLAYPNEPIQVQAEGDKLIISGAVSGQEVIESITKMAATFSRNTVNSMVLAEPPHEKQILLEVKFAEVDRSKIDQFGINILNAGLLNTPGSITTQQFGAPSGASVAPGTPGSGGGGGGGQGRVDVGGQIPGRVAGATTNFSMTDTLNMFLFRPDLNIAVTIKALQQQSVLQILAEPNILALNGKPARFLAGGEFPFPVVQGGAQFTAVTIQFRPFGVRLDFTGYITKEGTIRMQVAPEVSTLDFTNAVTISGFLVPAMSTRRAETEIELKDGQMFGMAGLIDQRTQTNMSKIPGIGDLPIIGHLFRSKNLNRSRTELIVLVTPHIVDPVRNGFAPPQTPDYPVQFLDKQGFDNRLPKSDKPPAALAAKPEEAAKPQ
ncbi:MAG: pilus assembly protein N-terminal domain-containing protein [Acidobacteria bacterium]|nr:pilus assembly protein N-terminal domain-containing protein [Acidobacteriota bacterium]